MPNDVVLAGIIVVALAVYTLTGGADFGGGVLDALARGPRAAEQRKAIAHAIGPIWEANHVWLILVVVLLFATFPPAFSAISTALHIPLTAMLIGIVLRGTAFVFRAYDSQAPDVQKRWTRVFSTASVLTPIAIGMSAGAVASGQIRWSQTQGVTSGFFAGWTTPFAVFVGLFLLAQATFLAAVYLCVETQGELREDFRTRALGAAVAVGMTAFTTLFFARTDAPLIFEGLTATGAAAALHVVTGLAAVGAIVSLVKRRYAVARVLAGAQVVLVLAGWALAQYPFIIAPDLTFAAAVTSPNVTTPVLIALAAGSVLLLPAFWYLYRVFKADPNSSPAPK
ncbi:MAG: cytochrome d ubiquinol oxidase subunit II [bacterium]